MEWPRHDKPGVRYSLTAIADLSFAQKHCRYLCRSGATRFKRLGSSNLVARTEYHTQLVLSTLLLKIFRNFFAVKFFLPDSCTLYRHSRLRLCKIHCFPLAFKTHLCYHRLCSTATPHLAAAFWQQGGTKGAVCPRRRFDKFLFRAAPISPPPESRQQGAAFQRLNS